MAPQHEIVVVLLEDDEDDALLTRELLGDVRDHRYRDPANPLAIDWLVSDGV